LAPINFMVAKIVKLGQQPVSIVGGVRYWAVSPDTGPQLNHLADTKVCLMCTPAG